MTSSCCFVQTVVCSGTLEHPTSACDVTLTACPGTSACRFARKVQSFQLKLIIDFEFNLGSGCVRCEQSLVLSVWHQSVMYAALSQLLLKWHCCYMFLKWWVFCTGASWTRPLKWTEAVYCTLCAGCTGSNQCRVGLVLYAWLQPAAVARLFCTLTDWLTNRLIWLKPLIGWLTRLSEQRQIRVWQSRVNKK